MTSQFTSVPHSHYKKKKKNQFLALKFAAGAAQALPQAMFQSLSPCCRPLKLITLGPLPLHSHG